MDIPWWYYAIAVILGTVVWRTWNKPSLGLLTAYVILLLAETVLIRKNPPGPYFEPGLFWSWKEWKVQKYQIMTNIVMFIPVGILTGKMWKSRGLLVAIGISAVIEVLQLITRRGLCEFDDVMHNFLGAVIGLGIVVSGKQQGK